MEVRIIRALSSERTSLCHDMESCSGVEGEYLLSFDKVDIEGKEYYAAMTYPGMCFEDNDHGTIFIHELFNHIKTNPHILSEWKNKNHEDMYESFKKLHRTICSDIRRAVGASHFEYAPVSNIEVIEELAVLTKFDDWS